MAEPAVFSSLAAAQLKEGMVPEAVDAYIKAKDAANFQAVIAAAQEGNFYSDLVRYLLMPRATQVLLQAKQHGRYLPAVHLLSPF